MFDRVAHADPDPDLDPVTDPDPVDDDTIAATRDDAADGDDLRAAAELARLVSPAWIDELAEGDAVGEPPHARPSRFGRLDLSIAWRHADRDPRTLDAYATDAVLVVATWRR